MFLFKHIVLIIFQSNMTSLVEQIIVYPFEQIQTISENFSATLDEETMNKLLDIKKNNRFIKRKSPLRLKYSVDQSTALAWRKEKENTTTLSHEERCTNQLVSNLNKLSNKNYASIFSEIEKLYLEFSRLPEISTKINSLIISTIFNKAMTEQNYSDIYAELILDLDQKSVIVGGEVYKNVSSICDNFYNENIGTLVNQISNGIPYEQLCEAYANKTKFIGGFIFISNLFKYECLDYKVVRQYYKGLVEYTRHSPVEYVEKYIDTIISIVQNSGEILEKDNPKSFKADFMDIIYELKENKQLVKQKYKFKLLDAIELYENRWQVNDEWSKPAKRR